jgi:hypothetical protein
VKLDKDLTRIYPECFVEYYFVEHYVKGWVKLIIKCKGEEFISSEFGEIEKRVDIQRAKKAGCRTAQQICDYLNGVR